MGIFADSVASDASNQALPSLVKRRNSLKCVLRSGWPNSQRNRRAWQSELTRHHPTRVSLPPTPAIPAPMITELPPRTERFFLLTLAGIQFSHVLDFMIMMPLGPILMAAFGIGTHEFGLLVASYSFSAAISA